MEKGGGFLLYLSKKQSWHIEPPWGLMNDPNGLIWYRENYDVFFQWNRFKKDHSSKAWGWCVSPDLIHWRFCGSALLPDQPYDGQGVYSGSAIEINNRLCLYYTGNARRNGRWISSQCMAVSEDGMHFQKCGPVLTAPVGYTQHFRDLRWFPAKTEAIGWCWGHNGKADMERCCFIHLPTGANGLLPE